MTRQKGYGLIAAASLVAAFFWMTLARVQPQSGSTETGGASGTTETRMSPREREEAMAFLDPKKAFRAPFPEYYIHVVEHLPKRYVVLHAEFKDVISRQLFELANKTNKSKSKGVHVFASVDRFADMFVDSREALDAVQKNPDIRWVDCASNIWAPPPSVIERAAASRGLPDRIVRSGDKDIGGLTGKGVVIVVIDTGIDFHHPDFITYEKSGLPTSRVLYFWDTLTEAEPTPDLGEKPPVTYPNGRAVGIVYSQKDLTRELRDKKRRISVWDTNGHGTACASIAAGNANAAEGELKDAKVSLGVAHEADIVAVRIGGTGAWNGYLFGAICDWVNAKIGDRPVVYSCSWGDPIIGDHDGNRVVERQLDARFSLDGKRRAVCFAAGNEGLQERHAAISSKGKTKNLSWTSNGTTVLQVYYDTSDPADLDFKGLSKEYIEYLRAHTFKHNITGKLVTDATFIRGVTIGLFKDSSKAVKADAYISSGSFSAGAQYGKVIRTPGSARNAITVGSYDWNTRFHRLGEFRDYDCNVRTVQDGKVKISRDSMIIGELSGYSSPGPNRDGTIKPDIVAPGQWFTAAAPGNTDAYRDTSGRYRIFNGTSAATPYTAGVVALLMQKKNDITLREIRELLWNNAQPDRFTKNNPQGWGRGKLNYEAVKKIIAAVR
jgi:subtilisin family serine protease